VRGTHKRILSGGGKRGHGRDPFNIRELTGARSLHATAGKSISVSLMRLKTSVKTLAAKARLISTSCELPLEEARDKQLPCPSIQ
jgi:hypothetical protein